MEANKVPELTSRGHQYGRHGEFAFSDNVVVQSRENARFRLREQRAQLRRSMVNLHPNIAATVAIIGSQFAAVGFSAVVFSAVDPICLSSPARQVCVAQACVAQVCAAQVCVAQVCVAQVCAGAAIRTTRGKLAIRNKLAMWQGGGRGERQAVGAKRRVQPHAFSLVQHDEQLHCPVHGRAREVYAGACWSVCAGRVCAGRVRVCACRVFCWAGQVGGQQQAVVDDFCAREAVVAEQRQLALALFTVASLSTITGTITGLSTVTALSTNAALSLLDLALAVFFSAIALAARVKRALCKHASVRAHKHVAGVSSTQWTCKRLCQHYHLARKAFERHLKSAREGAGCACRCACRCSCLLWVRVRVQVLVFALGEGARAGARVCFAPRFYCFMFAPRCLIFAFCLLPFSFAFFFGPRDCDRALN